MGGIRRNIDIERLLGKERTGLSISDNFSVVGDCCELKR
jgi:hypothetical protein